MSISSALFEANIDMLFLLQLLFSAIAIILIALLIRTPKNTVKPPAREATRGIESDLLISPIDKTASDGGVAVIPTAAHDSHRHNPIEKMQFHKELYFKLQNLEKYPEILPQARDLLVSLLSEALEGAHKSPKCSILAIERYAQDAIVSFLWGEHEKTTQEWTQYLKRRRSGQPLEMFKNRKEAKWWLEQITPLKYVDGACLGHIHKITTPFASRRATKHAWQVLSEELGDGDTDRNHVHVYRELMKNIGSDLPDGDTVDFIHPCHQLNQPGIWKAAVAHLLISLFPHEFLPEILGFNLHFEQLTLETLKSAKELQELKLDSSYFYLHICIDNADSGHTAIAKQAVFELIEEIQRLHGEPLAQQAWKRVQAGYIFSESLSTKPSTLPLTTPTVSEFPRNEYEAEFIRILEKKAPVANKIHCSNKMRIGRRLLTDWLDPDSFYSTQWQMDFLDDLAKTKLLVRAGDSSGSKLIYELSWKGKMFGAFTHAEVEAVKKWIDSLEAPKSPPLGYWLFVGRTETTSSEVFQKQDITVDYPVILPTMVDGFLAIAPPICKSPLQNTVTPHMSKFLPIWFTHPCLLESFISVPFKSITKRASLVLRVLRAQQGFDVEGPAVAGMDEVRRTNSIDLVGLGQEIMKRYGLQELACLQEVLYNWKSEFALMMLHLSMRPVTNEGLLLGLARAFVDLHYVMASSTLLSASSRVIIGQIAARERYSLDVCIQDLKGDGFQFAEFVRGYSLGRVEIERCGICLENVELQTLML